MTLPNKRVWLICALVVLALAAVAVLQLTGVIHLPFLAWLSGGVREAAEDGPKVIPSESIDPPAATEYLQAAGTIADKIPAQSSPSVRTEAQAIQDLADRGFDQYPVTTSYAMDGGLGEEAAASEASDASHPLYQTFYASGDNALWSIQQVNGQVTANPVTYNAEAGWDVAHIVSERETVYTYDGAANQFYEIVPAPAELIVKVVDRIDAGTLDALDAWEVDH